MIKARHLKNVIIFLFIMLTLGFIFGTFTLQLLVRSVVISLRQTGWLTDYEIIVVIILISAYLLFILLFAKWITLWLQKTKDITSAAVLFIVLAILSYLSLHYWLLPLQSPFIKPLQSKDRRFLGGPYPDTDLLIKLKTQGYSTVITLLDPLVFPDEAYLLNQEKKTIEGLGMKMISIPLMPTNTESLVANKQIETVAINNGDMKYYVHGNNDQQRIATFMQVANKFKRSAQDVQTGVIKNRYNTINLARGTAVQLDQHVIVSPKPTHEELIRYFTSTPNNDVKIAIRTIISMNTDDTKSETNDLRAMMKGYGINYFATPIPLHPYDPQAILSIVNQIKALPDGVLVYSNYMPPQSEIMSAFIMSYLTNLPALPKILFVNEKMQRGAVKVIAPNLAIGPQPTETEINELKIRGIRNIGFVGSCNGVEYNNDMSVAAAAGLEWICLQAKDVNIYQVLATGGPWYVYGPNLPTVSSELIQRFSVLMPDHALLGEQT